MVPVAGSAYTYTYTTMGEFLAWTVGWALILEYAVAASAVSVGWSGYFSGTILNQLLGVQLPPWLAAAPLALGGAPGGFITRSEEHKSELQSLLRRSYAVFCLTKKSEYEQPER